MMFVAGAHYLGKLDNGQIFDSSYNRGKPLKFRIGLALASFSCTVMGKYTGITSIPALPTKDGRRGQVVDQVVIGTPRTIGKWFSYKTLNPRDLKILVFDEADHMLADLSMGSEFFHSLPLSPLLDGSDSILTGSSVEGCIKKFTTAELIESYRCNQCWHNSAIKYLSIIGGNEIFLVSATFNETVKSFAAKHEEGGRMVVPWKVFTQHWEYATKGANIVYYAGLHTMVCCGLVRTLVDPCEEMQLHWRQFCLMYLRLHLRQFTNLARKIMYDLHYMGVCHILKLMTSNATIGLGWIPVKRCNSIGGSFV
ncbi:hypothetical protein IFM89_007374 [Coptis chinensis]|uniref:peptidylprolyl isomerase n=1 Tax=Coptis chinensis TaxID=261450 RepID=A0A835INN5_9MAGN|nr:hypothetical protein IFM89_007374 [Coptis chinensis]